MTQRLLMIEDDHRLGGMVAAYLTQNGFEVRHVETAAEGLAQLQQATAQPFSLILLDVMLPDADGLEVCRQIRAHHSAISATPIVMLTAKGDPMDRVVGLELGADDYVPKPFEPRELLARVRAVLRRQPGSTPHNSHVMRFGRLEIDLDARAIRLDGQERMVTGYQFDLLVALAERAGRVLSREQIMDAVKGEPLEAFDRSIDVHIGRLRAVLEDDPKQPRRIITVRGSGYVFAKAQDVYRSQLQMVGASVRAHLCRRADEPGRGRAGVFRTVAMGAGFCAAGPAKPGRVYRMGLGSAATGHRDARAAAGRHVPSPLAPACGHGAVHT
jgi:DNA-binding response OmpR family regulator